MATLKLKRSAVAAKVPLVGDLELGEIAINTYDGKVYTKKDNGTASIVEIGGGGAGTVTSVTGTAPIASSGGTTPAISISAATTGAAGSMSAADKTKLDGIATSANNYVLPKATASALGGVEVFDATVQTTAANAVTTTASRTYGVQLNSADQMVVNVPWAGGGGSTPTIGEVVQSSVAPSSGTWLQTGKYYSKASYPTLAAALGDVPDIGSPVSVASAQIPVGVTFGSTSGTRNQYLMATSGSAWVFGATTSPKFVHTLNGDSFTFVPTNAEINTITGVWYVNNLFVATTSPKTSGSSLLVSADGLNWSARTLRNSGETTITPTSVAYGAGMYVITHTTGMYYSTDLLNFTRVSSILIPNDVYSKVIYAGGKFVVVRSTGGSTATSTDGITWTTQGGVGLTQTDIVYLNGLYIAYGASSVSRLLTSPDAITYTDRTSVGFGTIFNVIFAGGQYVLSSNQGVYTSPDAFTWTVRTIPISNSSCREVAYVAGTYYVGSATSNGHYITSTDAITWTLKRDGGGQTFFSIYDVNGKAVGATSSGLSVLAGGTRESAQPSHSHPCVSNSLGAIKTIAYNGTNQFVTVDQFGQTLSSSDGINWTARPFPNGTSMTGSAHIRYANGSYIILGNNSTSSILTSTDGITWLPRTTPSTTGLNGFAFGASTYVAVGNSGVVFSSSDTGTWTSRAAGSSTFNDVTFGNSLFVAVGNSGACYTSPDGTTWTSRAAGSLAFRRVLFAAGSINLFIAFGTAGSLYTSPDGTTWTARSAGSATFNDAVFVSALGIVVGVADNGIIYSSTNGTTWTVRTPGDTAPNLNRIFWTGTEFLTHPIGSVSDLAFRSTDGITWTQCFFPRNISDVLFAGGKYVVSTTASGNLYYSTDFKNWFHSTQNSFRSSVLTNLQKVGNLYFACSANNYLGTPYVSTDGITFNRVRSFFNAAAVAYDGSLYYYSAHKGNNSTLVISRSTDGITWTYHAELGQSILGTAKVQGWGDLLYASGKLVGFINANYISTTLQDSSSVYYSSDGITWSPGQFPVGGYPGTLSFTGSGAMATDGTTLLAPATTSSVSYGLYKSTNSGATWTAIPNGAFAPIIYSGGYWNWQSYKSSDATTVISSSSNSFVSVNSHNGYTFNIFGTSAGIWEISSNASSSYFTYNQITPGSYGLISNTKPAPIRSSDNRVLTMANISTFTGTMVNPISEYPLFSYNTTTTFFVPQQVTGLASNEYIYAGA